MKILQHIRTRFRPYILIFPLGAGSAMAGPETPAPGPQASTQAATECVVLLHGLGRTHRSMAEMAEALQAKDYVIVNVDYPSREQPIEELADRVMREGIERCGRKNAVSIHFVTHSMGGILVRYFLTSNRPDRLGRVVMLSPPNQGSEAADLLRDQKLYAWFNGPAGQQLGTGTDSLPLRLGPVDFPLGIITGNRPAFYDTWLAESIPGPNDGKVSVARAQVAGMTDFLVLPYTHTFIMGEPEVISQTIHFLRYGRFRQNDASSPGAARPVD